jgi:hypothetical protein
MIYKVPIVGGCIISSFIKATVDKFGIAYEDIILDASFIIPPSAFKIILQPLISQFRDQGRY